MLETSVLNGIIFFAGFILLILVVALVFLFIGYKMGRNVYIPPVKEVKFDPGAEERPTDPWDEAMEEKTEEPKRIKTMEK